MLVTYKYKLEKKISWAQRGGVSISWAQRGGVSISP